MTCMIIAGDVVCYTEMELKDIHMMEQLHLLVAQCSKVGVFMKFSVSVAI